MSACWYGVWLRSVCVVSMIVQSLIKLRFCLTNVLYVAFSAFHEVYDKVAFTGGIVKYGI